MIDYLIDNNVEKVVEHYCNNCKHKNVSWREEPCLTCVRGESRWEAEEE